MRALRETRLSNFIGFKSFREFLVNLKTAIKLGQVLQKKKKFFTQEVN